MKLSEALAKETKESNKTTTLNGDKAFKSTKNANVDLFSVGGSSRELDVNSIKRLISQALLEDKNTALKNILYLSDIREGQGERRFFNIAIDFLYTDYPNILEELIPLIPEYGRWDYLYWIIEKNNFSSPAKKALQLISTEWHKHVDKGDSLMFKWLKSPRTSSKRSRELASITRKYLQLSYEEYSSALSKARKNLDIVEKKMSRKQWTKINYPSVPSKASIIYRDAFLRHDQEGYTKYLEDVKNGVRKINTSVLTPVDILKRYNFDGSLIQSYDYDETLELAWKNLPNYLEDTKESILPMVDVSGSMYGFPITAAVALGIYFSQRCNSEYKNKFLTFSRYPKLEKLEGNTLKDIINNMSRAEWGTNTDITSAFNTILKTAIKYNMKQEDLPSKLLILSDMQFDRCTSGGDITSQKLAKEAFKEAGYKLPELIFWNLNAEYGNQPVKYNKSGTCLISGYNPVILKFLVDGKLESPLETMNRVLNSERYAIIDTFKSIK